MIWNWKLKMKHLSSILLVHHRSSISELKKELMSLSEIIKSTPAKVKSSTEVQISRSIVSGGSVNWLWSDVHFIRIICKTPSKTLDPKRCIRGFSPEINSIFLIHILSFSLVAGSRIELPTSGLWIPRSNQLSYPATWCADELLVLGLFKDEKCSRV